MEIKEDHAMTNDSGLKKQNSLKILDDFREEIEIKEWDCWLSPPLCSDKKPGSWLSGSDADTENVLVSSGLYVWLLPRGNSHRFLHVGICFGDGRNLRGRTLEHFNNALAWAWYESKIRRLDKSVKYDFNKNGDGWRLNQVENKDELHECTEDEIFQYLGDIKVLYLLPSRSDRPYRIERLEESEKKVAQDSIRKLEGAIARTAAFFLRGEEQITNTISKTRCYKEKHYKRLKDALNNVLEMLPKERLPPNH